MIIIVRIIRRGLFCRDKNQPYPNVDWLMLLLMGALWVFLNCALYRRALALMRSRRADAAQYFVLDLYRFCRAQDFIHVLGK